MQYSYKATLVSLVTVVSMMSNCRGCKKNEIKHITIGSKNPNEKEENAANDEAEEQEQDSDKEEAAKHEILKEKFKTLFDSKIEICYKKAVMAMIKSITATMGLSPEVITEVNTLYEKSLDNIGDELKKRMEDHFSSFRQQIKELCGKLPPTQLKALVKGLENYPSPEASETNDNANKFLEKCEGIASGTAYQELTTLKIEQFKGKWQLITDYITDPNILSKTPPAFQNALPNSIKAYEETRIQSRIKDWKLHNAFNELYDSKIAITPKDSVMYAIQCIAERMQLPAESITKVQKLYADALDNNCIANGMKRLIEHHCASFKQALRNWCYALSNKTLDGLITYLKGDQSNHNFEDFIKKCQEIAPNAGSKSVNEGLMPSVKKQWAIMCAIYPKILHQTPKEFQDAVLQMMIESNERMVEPLIKEEVKATDKEESPEIKALKNRFEEIWTKKVTNVNTTQNDVIEHFCKSLASDDKQYNALKGFLEGEGKSTMQRIADDVNKIKVELKALFRELPFEDLHKITDYLENQYTQRNDRDPVLMELYTECVHNIAYNKNKWSSATKEKVSPLMAKLMKNINIAGINFLLEGKHQSKILDIDDTFKDQLTALYKDYCRRLVFYLDREVYNVMAKMMEGEKQQKEALERKKEEEEKILDKKIATDKDKIATDFAKKKLIDAKDAIAISYKIINNQLHLNEVFKPKKGSKFDANTWEKERAHEDQYKLILNLFLKIIDQKFRKDLKYCHIFDDKDQNRCTKISGSADPFQNTLSLDVGFTLKSRMYDIDNVYLNYPYVVCVMLHAFGSYLAWHDDERYFNLLFPRCIIKRDSILKKFKNWEEGFAEAFVHFVLDIQPKQNVNVETDQVKLFAEYPKMVTIKESIQHNLKNLHIHSKMSPDAVKEVFKKLFSFLQSSNAN